MVKPKKRTDAERRVRQCERLSRVLRIIRLIMGPGRWDAEGLARELECSPRTVHRIMQTLTMAEVPWYYSREEECYRVRAGFKFPGVDSKDPPLTVVDGLDPKVTRRLVEDSHRLIESLKLFLNSLEQPRQVSH